MKKAFITGIAGQDGSYLAELLLEKNYEVHGLIRSPNSPRLTHIKQQIKLHQGDLDDTDSLRNVLKTIVPDEIYHLASQSHVGQSFDQVEATCRVVAQGTLKLLEMSRQMSNPPRFFHASSSEIFGNPEQVPQNEKTPLIPVTPYGCAKAFATHITRVYRETFGLFAINGILFNHESPRRSNLFVTQKICGAAVNIKMGRQRELVLGNTAAQRDWGHAKDYVRGMWSAMQHDTPEDFVFATGELHSVQEVIELAFRRCGLNWREYVRQEPQFFRPVEPRLLIGDASKAKKMLGWNPKVSFEQLIFEMIDAGMDSVSVDAI